MTSTPVMSAPQEVTAKSLRQRVRVHGEERQGSESACGGGVGMDEGHVAVR